MKTKLASRQLFSSLKRKGRQDDCPGRHRRRWRQAAASPVTRAVILTTFPFMCSGTRHQPSAGAPVLSGNNCSWSSRLTWCGEPSIMRKLCSHYCHHLFRSPCEALLFLTRVWSGASPCDPSHSFCYHILNGHSYGTSICEQLSAPGWPDRMHPTLRPRVIHPRMCTHGFHAQ